MFSGNPSPELVSAPTMRFHARGATAAQKVLPLSAGYGGVLPENVDGATRLHRLQGILPQLRRDTLNTWRAT